YVLLVGGRARRDALVEALRAEIGARYGGAGAPDDYSRIIHDAAFARLQAHLDDARARGLDVLPLASWHDPGQRLFAPLLVLEPGAEGRVMGEELFGPILPLRSVASLDAAIDEVNRRERPLALYPFSDDRASVERILRSTLAGGVTVNDTLVHFGIDGLPFGGVGASGMGAYHGRAGFDRSEEHTSELQSRENLVCRLLLEKKKTK